MQDPERPDPSEPDSPDHDSPDHDSPDGQSPGQVGSRPLLDVAARLRQLDDDRDQGRISDAEYAERRSEILDEI